MTDEKRLANPEKAAESLPRGAGIIFRHYEDPNRIDIARRLQAICRRRGLLFIVGGDWKLAARLDADGLHLPLFALKDRAVQPGARLWQRQGRKILTAAAHGIAEVRRAKEMQADAAVLSPVFRTKSHPNRRPLGPLRCASIAHRIHIAIVLLGGIDERTFAALPQTSCVGIAGIGFVSPS